jgi:hypothetical protein
MPSDNESKGLQHVHCQTETQVPKTTIDMHSSTQNNDRSQSIFHDKEQPPLASLQGEDSGLKWQGMAQKDNTSSSRKYPAEKYSSKNMKDGCFNHHTR